MLQHENGCSLNTKQYRLELCLFCASQLQVNLNGITWRFWFVANISLQHDLSFNIFTYVCTIEVPNQA
jgi:hypothetical protein